MGIGQCFACMLCRSWQATASQGSSRVGHLSERGGWSALQAALLAALGAFQDSMWERRFADLAAGAAGAGCSPAGALAAIRAIPTSGTRGRLLRRHALLLLLRRAIPGRVGLCSVCGGRMPISAFLWITKWLYVALGLPALAFTRGPQFLLVCMKGDSGF